MDTGKAELTGDLADAVRLRCTACTSPKRVILQKRCSCRQIFYSFKKDSTANRSFVTLFSMATNAPITRPGCTLLLGVTLLSVKLTRQSFHSTRFVVGYHYYHMGGKKLRGVETGGDVYSGLSKVGFLHYSESMAIWNTPWF